jgi:carbon-monoxide dehydrogenase medium subunit
MEAVTHLLEDHGPEAKVLAGGQSLMPLLAFRLTRPRLIVDINRLSGLDEIHREGDAVTFGALVRHRDVELDDDLVNRVPMIRDAMSVLGHVGIRNRGTVAGSIAHADPSAEWPAIALALEAECTLDNASGRRTVPIDEFFKGFMTTAIEPDELLTRLKMRLPAPGTGSAFVEISRRHGDFAQAGAGAVLQIEQGRISQARITLLGLGMTPLRAFRSEQALIGEVPSPEVFGKVAELADEHMEPLDDVHADAGYKRRVGKVMVGRALAMAHARSVDAR